MLKDLDSTQRLKLMRFVCSFAWADLHVTESERGFVHRLVGRLALSKHEKAQVAGWMSMPPRAEEVDPGEIPLVHRQVFLDTVRGVMAADGQVTQGEFENYRLLEQLVR